jgi:hypothetical protein
MKAIRHYWGGFDESPHATGDKVGAA